MYQGAKEKGYKKLVVLNEASELVDLVYKYTKDFPKNEEYGLTSQLRRAVLSVPLNIVEGQASISKREFLNFLNIANRSLVETEYLLETALRLGYLTSERFRELDFKRRKIGIHLHNLLVSVRASI